LTTNTPVFAIGQFLCLRPEVLKFSFAGCRHLAICDPSLTSTSLHRRNHVHSIAHQALPDAPLFEVVTPTWVGTTTVSLQRGEQGRGLFLDSGWPVVTLWCKIGGEAGITDQVPSLSGSKSAGFLNHEPVGVLPHPCFI